MNPLLEVKNLSIKFGENEPAVSEVSFVLNKGETLALVGESGSGKSVTALSVLQLLSYPYAFQTGSIKLDGKEIIRARDYVLRHIRGNRVGMIFQEPMTSLNPLHSIEKQISETLIVHEGQTKEEARRKALELLKMVGLRDAQKRLKALPHELSGGERQRVMIAMALANNPDILIADEPTTALDVTVQAQILELLKHLQKQFGLSILFISHDLDIVRRMAHRVCVMKEGKIVESGEVEHIMEHPVHPYTKMLVNSKPDGKPVSVEKKAKEIIECSDLNVSFPIKKSFWGKPLEMLQAVDNVSLSIKEGQAVGLVGESGSGKTTLGFALLKLQESEGKIIFGKQEISDFNAVKMRPLRTRMQIVFQDPYGSLSPRLTVEQIVGEGLEIHRKDLTPEERHRLITEALKDVGLTEDMLNRYPHAFSGGQRQRIAIARALVLRPKLIVLDEPTSALDVSVQSQIIGLLKDLQKKYNIAYLFISHDMRVVRALADVVYVMKDGKIVESGSNPVIFKEPQMQYTRDLMAAAFDFKAHGE